MDINIINLILIMNNNIKYKLNEQYIGSRNEIIEYKEIIKCLEEKEIENINNKNHNILMQDNEDYLNNFFLLQQDYMENFIRKDLDRIADYYSISKRKLNCQVASLFGGRIAEEIVFGEDAVTTGASNDIERATEIAHKMVKLWGMSSVMGPMSYGEEEGEVFLGRQVTKHKHISDETFTKVDSEIRKIIDTNYSLAYKILEDNRDILDAMAAALVEFETIDTNQIDDLMARIPMREPAEVIDSEEASSELGTGRGETESAKPSSDKKPEADGSTEQFA